MKADRQIFSVSDMNEFVSSLFAQTAPLQNIWLKAEISNIRLLGKTWYFTLKDDAAKMAGIFFTYAFPMPKTIQEGDLVLVFGKVSLYPPTGLYQFVVTKFETLGEGDLLLKLKKLKEKLAKEGLFDRERKRPLPRFPHTVGVIAGLGSAAIKDVVVNIQRRFPQTEILFFPSLVQGPNAPEDLLKALNRVYKNSQVDVLILARGGGAEEDLSAFNDERVVRKVSESPIPTIAAIGHEINWSLVDLVADVRVSTPTAAAEAAVPFYQDILQDLLLKQDLMTQRVTSWLGAIQDRFFALQDRPWLKDPSLLYQKAEQDLLIQQDKMNRLMKYYVDTLFQRTQSLHQSLNMLNPKAVLERGYSMVFDEKGNIISTLEKVKEGQMIQTQLTDGIIKSTIASKEKK